MGEDGEDNLWSSLLTELQATRTSSLPPSKGILFLGDKESGKTTLVAKLQGNEDPKKGSGLEYSYIEIRDETYECQAYLSVSVLDGDPHHANLLRFALSEENLSETTVVLCASMQTPWSILPQLHKWANILEDHIAALKIPPQVLATSKSNLIERWRSYSDFVDFFDLSPPQTKSFTGNSLLEMTKVTTQGCEEPDPEELDTLSRNLGLDIIVVITKTDTMTQLESEFNMTEEKFDFVQQAVRKFCLSLGASLFYVSVKEDKNCDLLYKYLVHRIYEGPGNFNTPALVVERDALFIPAGWDSLPKIAILYENIRTFLPNQNYCDVIRSPQLGRRYEARVEIVAEQEQEFLARLYQYLGDTESAEGVLKTPERRVFGSPGVSSCATSGRRPDYSSASRGLPVNPSDGAISNFFHALLNKKSGQAALTGQTGLPGGQLPLTQPEVSQADSQQQLDCDSSKMPSNLNGYTVLPLNEAATQQNGFPVPQE